MNSDRRDILRKTRVLEHAAKIGEERRATKTSQVRRHSHIRCVRTDLFFWYLPLEQASAHKSATEPCKSLFQITEQE